MKELRSRGNKRYKEMKKLRSRKGREKLGLYIEEGIKQLDILEEKEYYVINEELVSEEEIERIGIDGEVYVLSNEMFNELSTQENSQGLLTIKRIKKGKLEDIGSNIVVLDRIQDPGNMGTILRILDAVGIKDLILIKGTVDPYNEKSIRSSMGSIKNINIIEQTEEEVIPFLKDNNYKIFGTVLSEKSINYDKMEVSGKNAIIFGNEGQGISEGLIKSLDEQLIIPIYGGAESLNVAIATALTLYKLREKIGG